MSVPGVTPASSRLEEGVADAETATATAAATVATADVASMASTAPAAAGAGGLSKLQLLKQQKAMEAAAVAADFSGGGGTSSEPDAVAAAIEHLREVCRSLSELDESQKDGFQRNFMQLDRDDKKHWDEGRCAAGMR